MTVHHRFGLRLALALHRMNRPGLWLSFQEVQYIWIVCIPVVEVHLNGHGLDGLGNI